MGRNNLSYRKRQFDHAKNPGGSIASLGSQTMLAACLVLLSLLCACGGGAISATNPPIAPSALTLTSAPASLNFGDVVVGASSIQAVTLNNTGTASLTVSQANVTGAGFSINGLTLPLTLTTGQSTSLSMKFAPQAPGSAAGSVSLVSNANNSPTAVPLTGNAVTLLLAASPATLNLGNVAVGGSSTQSVTLTSTGTGTVTISQANVTGTGFSISGLTLPLSLSGGQTTTFSVKFAPQAVGSATGSVSIISNAANSPAAVSLAGNGVTSLLSVTPPSVNFGNVLVGGSSTQTLALSNSGTASVTVSQANVTGTGFSISGLTLPLTLTSGQSANFSVRFGPLAVGSSTGNVSLVSNATNSPTNVPLAGSGVTMLLTASPTSLNFGDVLVGGSGTQTVTLTSTGTGSVVISQANVTGTGFSISGLTLPLTLASGQSSNFSVKFAPLATGSATGSVSLVSNATNSPANVSLAGNGVTMLLSASPTSLNFGDITLGSSSTQTVTLTNSGSASVTVSQANTTGTGFSITGLTLPLTLTGGQSAPFTVTFAPAATGIATGGVSIVSNAPNSPTNVSLAGNGVTRLLVSNPTSLNFGDVAVGGSSTQTVTLSNTGTASVTISQANVSGSGFSISGLSPPVTVPAGQNTTFSVQFAPLATGSVTGAVSIVSNATNSPATVSLTGNGVLSLLSATPTSVNFGNVAVGGSSTQTVTLTSTGTGSVTITQANVTGAGFSISGLTLPLTLAGGQSTNFSAKFAPTTAGSVTGSVSIISNASNSPTVVSLSGVGVTSLLSVNPTSLNFGDVVVGSSSTQSVTLTSTGTGSVTITQANVTGVGFSISGLTLPLTLGGGQSTSFSVKFAPTAAGSVTGSVSIISNASNSPTNVSLAGNGVTLLLSANPTSINFGNVAVGSSSTQTITLNSTGTGSVTITQANVTGTGFSISGLSLPMTLPGGQSTSFSATFAPLATGSVTGNVSIVSNATNSPTNVSLAGNGVASSHSVQLGWDASTSVVVGYNVYRGSTSGGPYTLLNSSPVADITFTDTSVVGGLTYFYAVTAVDSGGIESVNSNEVQAVVPAP